MNEKEFKRLNRAELVEIIYQFQLEAQQLKSENDALSRALESKEMKIANAGSIADAAMDLSGVFQKAQEAADAYLEQVYQNNADSVAQCNALIASAQAQADALLADAQAQADAIISNAQAQAAATEERAQKNATAIESAAQRRSDAIMQATTQKVRQLLKDHSKLLKE